MISGSADMIGLAGRGSGKIGDDLPQQVEKDVVRAGVHAHEGARIDVVGDALGLVITSYSIPYTKLYELLGIIGHAEAEQFRDLLCQGRAAVALERPAPLGHVDPDRRGDAAGRDPEMAVEAAILGGYDRVAQIGRDIFRGDLAAEGLAAPGKDLVV